MYDLTDYLIDFEEAWKTLTQRQKDCIRLAALGYTQQETADELSISRRTVRDHLAAAREKFPQYRQNR